MNVHSEAEWTQPSDRCPKPERWHATDPHSTEIEVSELVSGFVRALQPDYVVETGTCIGQTAYMIGLALQANGHGRCESLDVNVDFVNVARERCAGLPVSILAMSSLVFTPLEPIGFAWFDSFLELRIPEFERYRPFMRPGTVVGFHDTAPHFGDFGDAIDDLPGVRTIKLPTPRGVTFAEVIA